MTRQEAVEFAKANNLFTLDDDSFDYFESLSKHVEMTGHHLTTWHNANVEECSGDCLQAANTTDWDFGRA
jgi:hypothetical protein